MRPIKKVDRITRSAATMATMRTVVKEKSVFAGSKYEQNGGIRLDITSALETEL